MDYSKFVFSPSGFDTFYCAIFTTTGNLGLASKMTDDANLNIYFTINTYFSNI